jgi:hypothetical protein
VFERYAIVSQSDIHDAMAKLEAGQQPEKAKRRESRKLRKSNFRTPDLAR